MYTETFLLNQFDKLETTPAKIQKTLEMIEAEKLSMKRTQALYAELKSTDPCLNCIN